MELLKSAHILVTMEYPQLYYWLTVTAINIILITIYYYSDAPII